MQSVRCQRPCHYIYGLGVVGSTTCSQISCEAVEVAELRLLTHCLAGLLCSVSIICSLGVLLVGTSLPAPEVP